VLLPSTRPGKDRHGQLCGAFCAREILLVFREALACAAPRAACRVRGHPLQCHLARPSPPVAKRPLAKDFEAGATSARMH
jgi:hypothetical protein